MNRNRSRGVTLMELLVTLVILSILALAALPYAEIAVVRSKELELRRALRDVRGALDNFHQDWRAGKIGTTDPLVSEYGYPKSLDALIDGIELADAEGKLRRYLRRVPRNPFADQSVDTIDQWVWRSYTDEPDSRGTDGRDIYDMRTAHEGTALDGSQYENW